MTANKRFKPKRHCKDGKCHNFVLDKEQHKFLLILNSYEDCKDVVNVLNALNEENEQLKQRVEQLENNIEKYIGAKYRKFVDGEVGGWSIGTLNEQMEFLYSEKELNDD